MTSSTDRARLLSFHVAGIVSCCALLGMASAIFLITGCGTFFIHGDTSVPGNSGSTGPTGAATDLAYLSNSSSSSRSVTGYDVSRGTLTALSGSPYNLGFTPQAMVISHRGDILWASDGAGSIFAFSVSTTGAIKSLNNGQPVSGNEYGFALEVSPDGKYLFALNNLLGATVDQYTIASGGGLVFAGDYPLTGAPDGGTVVPTALKFAPSGNFLVATLGTGGANVFSYSNGSLSASPATIMNPPNTSVGFYGVDIDNNNRIFISGTNLSSFPGLHVYKCNSAGIATDLARIATGNGPRSVAATSDGSFIYVANFADGTISAFSLNSTNELTALTGSPFAAPMNVLSLTRDATNNYLLAAGYNSDAGYQLFSISADGALVSAAVAASGTNMAIPAVIAATH